jgi:hypothetical protein
LKLDRRNSGWPEGETARSKDPGDAVDSAGFDEGQQQPRQWRFRHSIAISQFGSVLQ